MLRGASAEIQADRDQKLQREEGTERESPPEGYVTDETITSVGRQAARNFRVRDFSDHVLVLWVDTRRKKTTLRLAGSGPCNHR
jgi:hypothetical protein